MAFITYSQNFEDAILHRAFKQVQRGFYLDVGANHPSVDSVTRAFYDRGWRGINIEPISEWFELLQKQRPEDLNLQLMASDCAGLKRFYEIDGSGLSTDSRESAERLCAEHQLTMHEHQVPALTLTQILQEQQVEQLHFLKIDVEGAELAVLRGLDLDAFRPWVVLVEATEPMSQVQCYAEWEPLLTSKGYQFVYADGLNRYYLADERADLKPAFSHPPNVFDEIVPSQLVELHQQLDAMLTEYSAPQSSPLAGNVEAKVQPNNTTEYFRSISADVQQMHDTLKQRIVDLEQEVGEAWRVAAANELRMAKMQRTLARIVDAPRQGWSKLPELMSWVGANAKKLKRPKALKRLEERLRRFRQSSNANDSSAKTTQKLERPARIMPPDLEALKNNKTAA
jgi:FkbM family methyltransferase